MRILVVGGYGLIGGYVAAHLLAQGHDVIGAGRDVRRAARRFPDVHWIQADLASTSAAQWRDHISGVDAVVNCAGALQDGPRDDTKATHVTGLARLVEACEQSGMQRLVQISAAGVSAERSTPFNDARLEAERLLQASTLEWVVLRPALVLAPAAYGGSALLRGLAGFPLVVPVVHADSRIQVVSVNDLAEAVGIAVRASTPARFSADLCDAQGATLPELLSELRRWLGFGDAPLWRLPAPLAASGSRLSDALAYLGWRSPMRTASLLQLRSGVRGDADAAAQLLGRPAASLRQMLAAWPSGVQERWFARSYFVKPLGLAVLAAFWIVSGAIGLTIGREQAVQVLIAAGIAPSLAVFAVVGGSFVDLALGLMVCVHRTAPAALLGMVAVTVAYLAGGSLVRPDLWLDPLGPLVKSIPAAVLALACLALMDER